MKSLVGRTDSINFSSEYLFYGEGFEIERVKDRSVFAPKRWLETFGRSLTRNIVEAKILHTHLGLTIPVKMYAANPKKYTLEFAGLHRYDERSKFLRELLKELMKEYESSFITRIDIAIDFAGKIPNKVIKKLCEDRFPFRHKNTIYYKTKKEKKSNTRLNIKTYDKGKKEKLDRELIRLEFAFLGGYFNRLQVKDLNKAFEKMEKTIKRFTGLNVKISQL